MRQRVIWGFEFLGGALAWLFHLLATYSIGESVCILEGTLFSFLGINASGWFLGGVSVVALAVSISATTVSWRQFWRLRHAENQGPLRGSRFMALSSLIANLIFTLVILAQVLPIFFLLGDC